MATSSFFSSSTKYYDDFSIRNKKKDILSFEKPALYEFSRIIECLNLSKPRKIIEIGCGMGEYALALAKLGHEVTAVDTSRASLDLLANNAKNINWIIRYRSFAIITQSLCLIINLTLVYV